jgi:hypothetical protein
MSEQIWVPDEGDEVKLKDGRTGRTGDPDSYAWQGGSDWQVTVIVEEEPDPDAEEGESPEEEEVNEVDIHPDPATQGLWVEIGA